MQKALSKAWTKPTRWQPRRWAAAPLKCSEPSRIISGIVLTFARALGEFGATLMLAGNIPGKTQTIPTSIYYAVVTGKDEQATTLVFIMVLFSFTLVFGLNTWLKKKNYKGS